MEADLSQLLLAAQHPDKATRDVAEAQLAQARASNAPLYLRLLSAELSDESKQMQTRSLAGIQLKNTLTSKDDAQAETLANSWLALDPAVRTEIKEHSLRALGSPVREVRNTAASVVSKIATIELPKHQWPDLMPLLLTYVTQAEASPAGVVRKEATLNAIGYICEEIGMLQTDVLESQSNAILTAVVAGMRKEETEVSVKLAATRALLNALEFAKKNFDVENERSYIMQVACDACTAEQPLKVKCAAFECLVRIAELYYDKLAAYMQVLFNLTMEAIRKEEDDVARQAIEFWSTVCDKEYELGDDPSCAHYIKGAQPHLVPLLLTTLTAQEEGQDDDNANKAMSAGPCLGLIANTVGDEIVDHVVGFVRENMFNQDWHYRDAAILAFGYMLDGPSEEKLQPVVSQAVPQLAQFLKDQNQQVRDTTAWTFGRVCQFVPEAIAAETYTPLLDTFMCGLQPEGVAGGNDASSAKHICWAIHNMAEGIVQQQDDDKPPSNEMTERFMPVCQSLMAAADRPDAKSCNLRASAYEALCTVIQSAGTDSRPFLEQTLLKVLAERLSATCLQTQFLNQDDVNDRNEWQSLLCGALHALIGQMTPAFLNLVVDGQKTVADTLMELFCRVFATNNATAHEESLLAIGAVCNVLGKDFEKYSAPLCQTYLIPFLRNWQEAEVCAMAVHITGDLCRALEAGVGPVCDAVMQALIETVANPAVDSNHTGTNTFLKPPIFECIGDVALAITGNMSRYLGAVMPQLAGATTQVDSIRKSLAENEDEDLRFYLDRLSESILQAYTGLIQAFKVANKTQPEIVDMLLPHVDQIMVMINVVTMDKDRDDDVTRAAAGVVGDLAHTFEGKVKEKLCHAFVNELLDEARRSQKQETLDVAKWALDMLQAMR